MPDHVGAQTVFGSEGRGTGLGQKPVNIVFFLLTHEEPDHVTRMLSSTTAKSKLLACKKVKHLLMLSNTDKSTKDESEISKCAYR